MTIASNLSTILKDIQVASERVGREYDDVTLVAASKGHSIDAMREYLAAAKSLGVRPVFGESYVQEAKTKVAELSSEAEFHLMGPLQSNKVRDAVALFDLIQSVHSSKVLSLISKEASKVHKVQRVLLQVNISLDPNKSGLLPSEIGELYRSAQGMPGIRVEGVMAITANYDDEELVRRDFRALKILVESLRQTASQDMPLCISMGMSADYSVAIEEGSTMVRIGTAIFGDRDYSRS